MSLLDSVIDYVSKYTYPDEMEVVYFERDKETNIFMIIDIEYKKVIYNIILFDSGEEIYWKLARQKEKRTILRPLAAWNDYDYFITLIRNELI